MKTDQDFSNICVGIGLASIFWMVMIWITNLTNYYHGKNDGIKEHQRVAVSVGAAEYTVNDKGSVYFKWKEKND